MKKEYCKKCGNRIIKRSLPCNCESSKALVFVEKEVKTK